MRGLALTTVEPDLPVAYLVGYERIGVTSTRGQRIEGELRHVTNEVRYAGTDARTLVNRPGWSDAEPRAALTWLMFHVAVERYKPFSEALDACAEELDQESHDFRAAVLRVDAMAYEAVELSEKGLTARAAIVDGWTVVACVPDSAAELAVELVPGTV